ncbi:MAG: hypothetical protein ACTSYI_03845 [Promethearchaeota archaeon]
MGDGRTSEMIGSQIIFQIYATHATHTSGGISKSSNRPKFPPDILPPYDFDTMGEIHVIVIAQNKVRVEFAHESKNIQIELRIQAIENVIESPPVPINNTKHISNINPRHDSRYESKQAPINVYRCTMDKPNSRKMLITSSTMILHMYDERAIVSLAYDIRKHEKSWRNAIPTKTMTPAIPSKSAKTYWLQGISPLGYHQVDLDLSVEPDSIN